MPPGITWHEEDTDSDQDGHARASSSSSGGRTPDAPLRRVDDERALSPEELGRMQDEFLALQMHQRELLEERSRLYGQAAGNPALGRNSAAGSSMLTAAGAAAFGRSLSTQMKAGTGAISAFGVRGVASLQSTWTKGGGTAPVGEAVAAAAGAEDGGAREEREALRAEVELLRSRIRATLEEVEEFRTVAADAQQVVAAAEQAARDRVLALPPASDIRQKVSEGGRDEDPELELVRGVDDEELLRIGDAVLQLVNGERQGNGASEGNSPAPGESDEDRILLQRKIDTQQEELDRLLELFHQQQEQIIRLKDQLSGKGDPEKKKQVKEKLRNAERQAEGLTRELETTEQGLRQDQELRGQLRALAMQAVQRDQVIAEMRSMFDTQAAEVNLLRERLLHSLEDLFGHSGRRAERQRRTYGDSPMALAPSVPAGEVRAHAATGSTSVPVKGMTVAAGSPGVVASTPTEMSTASVQAELDEDGTLAACAESVQLRMEIDDIRVEKAVLEKRTAKQLQELQALVEPTRMPGRRSQPAVAAAPGAALPAAPGAALPDAPGAGAPAHAGAPARPAGAIGLTGGPMATAVEGGGPMATAVEGSLVAPSAESVSQPQQVRAVVYHDISSDGEDGPERPMPMLPDPDQDSSSEDEQPEYSAGMLFVQTVADLEQRNDVLRQELDDLHEAERGLRAGIKEKTDLIARLIERAKLPQPSRVAAGGQERGFWRSRRRNDADGESRDLERTIEETQEDNIRLRNDLQIMSEEFRKVLAATNAGVPKKA